MNDELGNTCVRLCGSNFLVVYRQMAEGAKENHEAPQSR